MYGGRIFPDRPENSEIGRNDGFSGRQSGSGVSGCRQFYFAAGILLQVLNELAQRRLRLIYLVQRIQELP